MFVIRVLSCFLYVVELKYGGDGEMNYFTGARMDVLAIQRMIEEIKGKVMYFLLYCLCFLLILLVFAGICWYLLVFGAIIEPLGVAGCNSNGVGCYVLQQSNYV